MIELTEQQEQEMIARAKAGDPEANYQMSLWALEQSMAEPEEERWNRLAAKCLVKAAEAGYEPAREKMEELLIQPPEPETPAAPAEEAKPAAVLTAETAAPQEPAEAAPAEDQPDAGQDARQEDVPPAEPQQTAAPAGEVSKPKADIGAAVGGFFAGIGAWFKGLADKVKSRRSAPAEAEGGAPAAEAGGAGSKKPAFLNFSEWDDAKWKRMQIVCIVICVILALLIAIMLITGRSRRSRGADGADAPASVVVTTTGEDSKEAEPEEEPSVIPQADEEVVSGAAPEEAEPTPAPTPETPAEPYPDDDVREEIAQADLDVYPEEDDYVTEATKATVSTSGNGLNVRRGPGSNYDLIDAIDNDTTVDVYAYRNGWGLVKYDGYWGWCSKDYLK